MQVSGESHLAEDASDVTHEPYLYREISSPHKLFSSESPVPFKVTTILGKDTYAIQSIISRHPRRAHASKLRRIEINSDFHALAHLNFCLEKGEAVLQSIKRHKRSEGSYLFEVEWLDDSLSWEPSKFLRQVSIFKDYIAKNRLVMS